MSKTVVEECQRITVLELKSYLRHSKSIEANNQTISVTQTPCNFGGWRNWFLCPNCIRRVGVLYRKPMKSQFLCRDCHNLTYQLTKYRRSRHEVFIKAIHKMKIRYPTAPHGVIT